MTARRPHRGRHIGRDAGVATVAVASLLLLVVTATMLAVAGVTATTARHQAQLAADLAALAGAGRIGVDTGAACTEAGRVAVANGARLQSCTVAETGLRTGEVRVEVARPQRWAGIALDARARARAARVPPATAARGPPGSVVPHQSSALGAGAGCVWQHDRAVVRVRSCARRSRTVSLGHRRDDHFAGRPTWT